MRNAAFAFIAALSIAACNPSAPAPQAEQSSDAAFPNLASASYRAEATITDDGGRTIPMVMIRSGAKLRMEVNAPGGASTIVTNGETGESFIISNAAGRQVAMRMTNMEQFKDPASAWSAELASSATRTGSCSAAGESGSQWTRTENGAVKTACVSSDGILLAATDSGRTVWETTSVERGAQSADLFDLPPGVQVLDLNNLQGMADAVRNARGGN